MAYISQEKKKEIAANLKKIMPKGWKYSLRIDHYTSLVMTIKEAPVDLSNGKEYIQVNPFYPEHSFEGETLNIINNALACMNEGNHDNSDSMTDYFDVGWYVNINVGRWDKPFKVTA